MNSILGLHSPEIAKAMVTYPINRFIGFPRASRILTQLATTYSFGDHRHTSDTFCIPKLIHQPITESLMVPSVPETDMGVRPIKFAVTNICTSQKYFPATITLSRSLTDTSPLNLAAFASETLKRYSADLIEKQLELNIKNEAHIYSCKEGRNGKAVTEITINDLNNIRAYLENVGASTLFAQFTATPQYSTSGVGPAYAFVTSSEVMSYIQQDLDLYNVKSYVPTNQFAGSKIYSNNVRGHEISSALTFLTSNLLDCVNDRTTSASQLYDAYVISADSYILGITSPTQNNIIHRSGLHLSSSGLISDYTIINPITICVTRPSHLVRVNFTRKATAP